MNRAGASGTRAGDGPARHRAQRGRRGEDRARPHRPAWRPSIAGRPFVTYAADGLLVATPTGSTAYNLSARGPILSPGLRAIVVTPVSPHMLFDRTLVLEPEQWVRLEVLGPRPAVLVLDGQSADSLEPGDAVDVPRGPGRRPAWSPSGPATSTPSCGPGSTWPIADGRDAPCWSSCGCRDLGVIEAVTLDLGPGMTALTGETGAGKTLLVEALELLVGGRADPGLVRPGADRGPRRGPVHRRRRGGHPGPGRARPGTLAGLDRRPHGAGLGPGRGRGPAARPPRPARPSVPARRRPPSAGPSTPSRGIDLGPAHRRPRAALPRACRPSSRPRAATTGPGPARPTCCATSWPRSTAPGSTTPTRTTRWPTRRSAWPRPPPTATPPPPRLAALDATATGAPAAAAGHRPAGHGPRPPWTGGPRWPRWPDVWPSLQADAADVASELRTVVETWEDDPERLEEVRARRQLLRELARKYGEGVAGVLAFADEARRPAGRARRRRGAGRRSSRASSPAAEPTWPRPRPRWARRGAGAAPELARAVEERLRTLAMPHARIEVTVGEPDPGDDVTFLLGANPGEARPAAGQGGLGGRAGPGHAGPAPGAHRRPAHHGLRRGRRRRGGRGRPGGGPRPGRGGPAPPGPGGHAPGPGGRVRPPPARRAQGGDRQDGPWPHAAVLDDDDRVVELARMLSGRPDSATARRHAEELLGTRAAPAPRHVADAVRHAGAGRWRRGVPPVDRRAWSTVERCPGSAELDQVRLRHRRSVLLARQGSHRLVARSAPQVPGPARHDDQARPLHQRRPGHDEPLRARRGVRHPRRR